MSCWRFALASVVGVSHSTSGVRCQDVSDCRLFTTTAGEPLLVAVASDGAGSALQSRAGAQDACELFIDAVASLVCDHGTVTDFTAAWFGGWVSQFQRLIALKADASGASPRAFAATLSAAIVGETTAALMQVGDGAVIAASGNDPSFACLLQPFNGEYANTTSFLTDVDALETAQHRLWSGRIEDLAVITDGLGRVALNMQTREAYTPFFRPMFRTLGQRRDGHQRSTSLDLHDFLHSTRVNQRVDDDKTLIVASRRPVSVCSVATKQPEHEPDRVG